METDVWFQGEIVIHVHPLPEKVLFKIDKEFETVGITDFSEGNSYPKIIDLAQMLSHMYRTLFNEEYQIQLSKMKGVAFPCSAFRYARVHRQVSCPLHLDKFVDKEVYSAIFIERRQIHGGHLIFPEFQLGVGLDGKCIVFLKGNKYWHGVTPIRPETENGFRLSIGFY